MLSQIYFILTVFTLKSKNKLNLHFRAFDHNGDGTISKDELKEAMQRFGHSFTEDECDEMFVQVHGVIIDD